MIPPSSRILSLVPSLRSQLLRPDLILGISRYGKHAPLSFARPIGRLNCISPLPQRTKKPRRKSGGAQGKKTKQVEISACPACNVCLWQVFDGSTVENQPASRNPLSSKLVSPPFSPSTHFCASSNSQFSDSADHTAFLRFLPSKVRYFSRPPIPLRRRHLVVLAFVVVARISCDHRYLGNPTIHSEAGALTMAAVPISNPSAFNRRQSSTMEYTRGACYSCE